MAINLLTRSSDSNTAYIVIFGSTSITNLQRLSKTVEYSCRWSSGTLVNLMAAIPGASAKDATDKLAGHGEEQQQDYLLRVIYSFFVRCTNIAAPLICS
jgi:hypothetical protein